MKRTIGLLVGAAALGLLSTHCSDDGGDDTPGPSGGAPAAGAPAGGASAGVAGKATAGSPNVGGGGATAGTGGSATGGSSAGAAGKAGGGAGMGGASGGSGGKGGSAGASAGSGGATGGSGGATGGSGGAQGGSGGASGGSGGGGGTGNVGTFAQVTQILGSKCAQTCHAKGNGMHTELHSDGLYQRLTTPMTKGDCLGVTLVKASDAAGSLLNTIVRNGKADCGTGMNDIAKMPKNCSDNGAMKCLSSMELQTIESWISAGAQQ